MNQLSPSTVVQEKRSIEYNRIIVFTIFVGVPFSSHAWPIQAHTNYYLNKSGNIESIANVMENRKWKDPLQIWIYMFWNLWNMVSTHNGDGFTAKQNEHKSE